MRVLLLNPPSPDAQARIREGRCQDIDRWSAPFPPLTLAYVATQVEPLAEVRLVDAGACGIGLDRVLALAAAAPPDLLVFTTSTPTADADLRWFLPAFRRAFPATRTATTGVHATVLAARLLAEHPALDFVLCGEPERPARDLVAALRASGDPAAVAGLAWRNAAGEVVVNPPAARPDALDDLGIPAWHHVDLARYRMPIKGRPFALVCVTRGCPFPCAFCVIQAYHGKAIRRRSPESVVAEIRMLRRRGVRDFLFWTEFLTADRAYLARLTGLLVAEGLGDEIRWVTNARPDTPDPEAFRQMRRAGCWQVVIGLEFGTDAMLAAADKGGHACVETSRRTVEAAANAGLAVAGHFILGYPGETAAQMEATVALALELPLTFAQFYAATPFPGSRLHDEALRHGWIAAAGWDGLSLDRPSLHAPGLPPEVVAEVIARAYRRFYLRPRTWARILRVPEGLREHAALLASGVRFVRGTLRGRGRALPSPRRAGARAAGAAQDAPRPAS